MRALALALGLAMFALPACSSSGDGGPDGGGAGGDGAASADAKDCSGYVCGPFGTKQGDIMENLSFTGLRDPDDHCKDAKDKQHDLTKFVPWDLAEYFRGSTKCPSKQKKMLWIMVSAGWCKPCIDEIKSIMKQYGTGGLDPRVEVMDVLFEDDKRQPVTEAFARKWQQDLGITFPMAIDPKFVMSKYFQRNAVPVNLLVDLRTMEIFFFQTGVSLSRVGQEMVAFLARLDGKQ